MSSPSFSMRIAFCACALWIVAVPGSPGRLELPATVELTPTLVSLQLSNAEVRVVFDSRAEPGLRARRLSEGGPASVALLVEQRGSGIHVSRPEAPEELAVVVGLEIVVPGPVPVSVEGSALDLFIEDRSVPGEEASPSELAAPEEEGDSGTGDGKAGSATPVATPPAAGAEAGLAVAVSGSLVTLLGTGPAQINLVECEARLERGQGDVLVVAENSAVEVASHQGALGIQGQGLEIQLADTQGTVSLELAESNIEAQGGRGSLSAVTQGGFLLFERWRGPMTFESANGNLEIRESRSNRPMKLSTRGVQMVMDSWTGDMQASFKGGSLTAENLDGKLMLQGEDGAELELERLRGGVTLTLLRDASASVQDVRRGSLTADVRHAHLEVEQVGRLQLTAHHSTVEASGIIKLERFTLVESRVNVDLRESRGNPPRLVLQSGSEAQIKISAPCTVKLEGPGSDVLDSRAKVSGCELQTRAHGRRRYNGRGLDGKKAVTLTASVTQDSYMEVDGE